MTVSEALNALAAYQKKHAAYGFVVRGPYLLTENQRAEREAEVLAVVDKIEELAREADVRPITYAEIEPLLSRFRAVGKPALSELVSNTARAIAAELAGVA